MKKKTITKKRAGVSARLKTFIAKPQIYGGKIDYNSFGEDEDLRTWGSLDRLTWITNCGLYPIESWPQAFKNLDQAEQFLNELTHELAAWRRLTDNMAIMLAPLHFNGGRYGDEEEPLANFSDAARVLKMAKVDYFDKGITLES